MSDSATRPTVLRWTRFKSDSHGNGPEKRSAQIRHLCESAGVALVDLQPPAHFSRVRTLADGLWLRLRHGRHLTLDRVGPGLLGYRHHFFRSALAAHPEARAIVWETTYDDLLPLAARHFGKRLIAVPHNLEALVSDAVFASPTYDPFPDLAAEVRRLARADAVFTIAREERWLLESRGVPARYLPFFPEPSLERECLALRARRPATDLRQPLLLLGSAFNPATARGLRQHLEWLRASSRPVVVAGPKTDELFASFASDRVRVLGLVSRDVLAGLLTECGAIAIHTEAGAGAVTRIPEALLAGLPVIANSNALRDCHEVPGTHRYETREEFLALAAQALPLPPAPPRPLAGEVLFQSAVRRAAVGESPFS